MFPLFAIAILAVAAVWVVVPRKVPVDQADNRSDTSNYRIEGTSVAWRPMSWGEQAAVGILTFGLASNSENVKGRILSGADAISFRALGSDYGRDRRHVWYHADEIAGADPASFAVLGFGLSRDKAHIWQETELVMTLDPNHQEKVEAYSERIFTVGAKTWLTGPPLRELDEAPRTVPVHYCRDWFEMNDALWDGTRKVLPVSQPIDVIACDGSINTQYKDGVGVEDIDGNTGILFRSGETVWRGRLERQPEHIADLPEPVSSTLFLDRLIDGVPVLLARVASGDVYAVNLQARDQLQLLGRFDALPTQSEVMLGDAFWLGDHYMTLVPDPGKNGPLVEDHGPAKAIGEMALTDGDLYYGSEIIARPGDLPLRQIGQKSVLVGPSCLNYGDFVSDVPDPSAEAEMIYPLCDVMRPPDTVLYEGLEIGFLPQLIPLGADADQPDLKRYRLGEMAVTNTTDAPLLVSAAFLQGLRLKVMRTDVKPPANSWPEEGLALAPGTRHDWPIEVLTDDNPLEWGWVLYLHHSRARVPVFGDKDVGIGHGGFNP